MIEIFSLFAAFFTIIGTFILAKRRGYLWQLDGFNSFEKTLLIILFLLCFGLLILMVDIRRLLQITAALGILVGVGAAMYLVIWYLLKVVDGLFALTDQLDPWSYRKTRGRFSPRPKNRKRK